MNNEITLRLTKAIIDLLKEADKDEILYGNAYFEISNRKIELKNPKDIIISKIEDKNKTIYGENPIKPQ